MSDFRRKVLVYYIFYAISAICVPASHSTEKVNYTESLMHLADFT